MSWRRNHSCDTFSCGDVLSNSGENKGLCHIIFWVQTSCQAHNHDGEGERVGSKANLHVVFNGSVESPSLVSVLRFLESSETSHSIDAGHTVTCLVHDQDLVDSLKPALVHDDRPIADSCLGRHSSLGNCDHGRLVGGKWHKQ